jgi:hypothetical protein
VKHSLVWLDDLTWFKPTREALLTSWVGGCESFLAYPHDDPCGQLFSDVVDIQKGHVSLACSLVDDQAQITALLNSEGFDTDPILFFRLLLFLLDEFTERISESYQLLGEKKRKQPTKISLWANKYAKHKLIFFIQHHARHVFQDGHEPMYEALARGAQGGFCLRSGFLPERVMILDESWLRSTPTPQISSANREEVPAVLIPKFQGFINAALDYYRDFVTYAKSKPKELEKFQSQYHWPITPEVEAENVKLMPSVCDT